MAEPPPEQSAPRAGVSLFSLVAVTSKRTMSCDLTLNDDDNEKAT